MFLYPLLSFFRVAQDANGNVPYMRTASALVLIPRDDNELFTEAERAGHVACAHGKDSLEVQVFDGLDAILDAARVHL